MPNQGGVPKLNDLLHWAVENTNTNPSTTSIAPHSNENESTSTSNSNTSIIRSNQETNKKLDTKFLDQILGRSDSIQIQEYIEIFENSSLELDQRIQAGEGLEDLVQDLDNANDLEVLGVWPKLIKLLEEPNDLIQFHTCWIIGTSVQNNPKSQSSFLKYDPIPLILNILNHSSNEETQAKALYCLSSTLKHAPSSTNAFTSFLSSSGFEALNTTLKGPSMNLRRKTVFLINSLAMQSHSILQSLRPHLLFKTLLNSISPTHGIPTGSNGEGSSQDDD
ncbi:armadillo-type protein [Melampsora americana]|nr:armadillo-type protein [Melampsora americana]